ncbi:4451_t:CDS:2, partial [Dentiscutata heterogama]
LQGLVENSNKTLKNALSTWMEDNEWRDWSIGLPIVTYAMNIRCSRPTSHTPYELVFGQHLLHRFNIIEELKQHNINMEEDLLQDMVRKNEFSDFEIEEQNLHESADDYTILMQQPIHNKNADDYMILMQQTICNDQQMQQHTQDDNIISDNWEQHIEDKENQETTNSDFVSYKKYQFFAFQEASNSSTHHDIYCQVANRNLEDYRSKMECQMHTKYNIQELLPNNIYRLVCRFGVLERAFSASEVLPLGPREFSKLDNPPTYKNIATAEVIALRQNAFVKKQTFYVEVDIIQRIPNVKIELENW